MLRTLKTVMRQDKEKFKIPKSVQQAIPIQTIWKDGIFLVGKNKYAKTYRFTDINFEVASEEDKKAMFLEYTNILNFFDCGATTKLTVIIRRLNKEELKEAVFIRSRMTVWISTGRKSTTCLWKRQWSQRHDPGAVCDDLCIPEKRGGRKELFPAYRKRADLSFQQPGFQVRGTGRTGKTSCTVQLLPGRRGKSFLF